MPFDSALESLEIIADQLKSLLKSDPILGEVFVCEGSGTVNVKPNEIKFYLKANQLDWTFTPDFESRLTLENDAVELRVNGRVLKNRESIVLNSDEKYDISVINKSWIDLDEPVRVKLEEF